MIQQRAFYPNACAELGALGPSFSSPPSPSFAQLNSRGADRSVRAPQIHVEIVAVESRYGVCLLCG